MPADMLSPKQVRLNLLREWRRVMDKAPENQRSYVAGMKDRIEAAVDTQDSMSLSALKTEIQNRLAGDGVDWFRTFSALIDGVATITNLLKP